MRLLRFTLRPRALVGAVAGLVALLALVAAAPALANTEVLVNEAFTGASPTSSSWALPSAPTGSNVACLTAGTSTSEQPIPACSSPAADSSGNGALRLTANSGGEEGGVAYGLTVPTVDGIDATFDSYQYARSGGADGIGFFLAAENPADPAPPADIGQPGGALGYSAVASSTKAGMSYGYLGIGLDVYGNYENTDYEGTGCVNPAWDSNKTFPNNVSVRGPGNGTTGYCMLNSTQTASGDTMTGTLDGGTTAPPRASAKVPVEVVINPSSSSVSTVSGLTVAAHSYEVAFTPLGASSRQTLSGSLPSVAGLGFPASWYDPTTGIPYQLTFGWVGSTGGDMEVHEVNDVSAGTVSGIPPTLTASVMDSAGGAPASGSTFDYNVTIGNQSGASTDPGPVSVTDTLPAGETPVSTGMGTNGWSCTISGQTVSCQNAGPLAGGAILPTLVIPATVTAAGGTELTDTATASSNDSDPATGQDTVTVATSPTDTSTCGTPDGTAGWFVTDPTCIVQGTDSYPAVDHVAYQLDSGSVVTTSAGTTTATVPVTSVGTHTLKTEVFNASNQSSGWRTQTIDVDTAAPTDTSSCGAPDGQNGYFVSDPTCAVQGTDSVSGVDHVAYQLDSGSVITTSSGTATAGVPITSDGTHTLKTRIFNAAGLDSGWRTQTIKVDTTPPAAPAIDSPADGSVSNDTSPTVTITGEPGDSATIEVDGSSYGPVTLDAQGNGEVQLTGPLAAGQHQVQAQQSDPAGNTSAWSADNVWTVKTQTDVQLSGPTSGPTDQTTPTVTYSGEPGDEFTITVDGQSVATGVIPSGGSGSLTLPSPLADGPHTVAISATDVVGNQASDSIVVTVDMAGPTVSIVTAPAQYTASHDATFSFTSGKPVTYQCSVDGAAWTACPSPVTFYGLQDGPHTLLLRGTDQAGNVSPSAQYSWTIETTPPPAPVITGGPDAVSSPGPAQFVISTQPDTSLQCSLDNQSYEPCSEVYDLQMLPVGTYVLVVRAVDEAGNVSSGTTYTWTVAARPGPAGLPRTAALLIAARATADGGRSIYVGCSLDAGSMRRCRVTAYYHHQRVGTGMTAERSHGHTHTVVTVWLNALGRRLLRRADGGLPLKLIGRAEPFGFSPLHPRTHTVIYEPLRFVLGDVLFKLNSSTLTAAARAVVAGIAHEIHGATTVVCQGNTDSFGSDSYNYRLGLRRARAVCELLRQLGVHAHFGVISYGKSRPVVPNDTPQHRHLNRRVVIRVSFHDLVPPTRAARSR